MLQRALLSILLLAMVASRCSGAIIFSETFGTVAGPTSFAAHTGWTNGLGLTFSGNGDVRGTTQSSGYAGASASANVFLTNNATARFLQIGNINTAGYDTSTLNLSLGAFKFTTASDLTNLVVSFSTDGNTFTNLVPAIPAQSTGAGTAVWRLLTLAPTNLAASSTLSLRFTNTSTTDQVRLDDITLSGTLAASAVPEPSSLAFLSFVGCSGLAAAFHRRRKVEGSDC